MNDAFGQPLHIGDTVSFMETGYVYEQKVGIISRTTEQKVVILWVKRWKDELGEKPQIVESYKFPKQVAKGTPASADIIRQIEAIDKMEWR